MKTKIICACMLIGIGCNFYLASNENPYPRQFHYYKQFSKDSLSKLRLDGIYIYREKLDLGNDSFIQTLKAIRFYDDGLLIKFSMGKTTDSAVLGLSKLKRTSGEIFGYYILKRDSVFFSTMSFYDKSEKFYKAKLMKDLLVLNYLNFYSTGRERIEDTKVFYFVKE